MAQTTGIINGSDLKIMMVADGGSLVVIDNVTDCSISVTNDFRDTTVKANAGYKALLPGMTSATMNFTALYQSNSTGGKGFNDISTLQLDKEKLDITFTHVIGSAAAANAGDFQYVVKGYIESLDLSGGTEDNASYTCSIQIVETIVRSVIS
tara:strand:+ start:183 stop:638 length:456 start_codon:yes stop_codon:yes gene_type:complete